MAIRFRSILPGKLLLTQTAIVMYFFSVAWHLQDKSFGLDDDEFRQRQINQGISQCSIALHMNEPFLMRLLHE